MVAREHHRVDRRLLPPRRNDSERRLGERRLEVISLDDERRDQAERRRAIDRRQPTGRRQVEARGDKLVVLVVSDQEEEARRVRDLLAGADLDRFDVAATAPQESLGRLARGGIDVVLLAMSLSARRGFTTFTELRALAPAVPFLFLSDAEDERNGLEAVRAGAQDFLVKSDVDGPVLAHALRLAIERNRLHAALLDLALVDALTGLYNRPGCWTPATRDLPLARRRLTGPPLWRSSANLVAPIPTARSGTISSSCSRVVTPTSRSRTRWPTGRPSSGARSPRGNPSPHGVSSSTSASHSGISSSSRRVRNTSPRSGRRATGP